MTQYEIRTLLKEARGMLRKAKRNIGGAWQSIERARIELRRNKISTFTKNKKPLC